MAQQRPEPRGSTSSDTVQRLFLFCVSLASASHETLQLLASEKIACFIVRCLRFFCETVFTLLVYRAGHVRTVHVSQLHLLVYLPLELVS